MKIKLISHQSVLNIFKTKVRDEYFSSNSSKIKWFGMLSTFIAGGILNCIALLLDDNYWLIGVYFIWSSVERQKHLRQSWYSNEMYFEAPCVLWCVWFLQDSFQTLKKWVKELKEHGPEDIVVAIAGNKTDLADIRFKPSSSFWKWIILSKVSQPLSLYFHISHVVCDHFNWSRHEIKISH